MLAIVIVKVIVQPGLVPDPLATHLAIVILIVIVQPALLPGPLATHVSYSHNDSQSAPSLTSTSFAHPC